MSSSTTTTSTTSSSNAGEGAEEAAKDSADIAAFFRSGVSIYDVSKKTHVTCNLEAEAEP
ncbi:protein-lysine methyltransferase METTL21D [Platysternon megacephalum]|uniref:Protein-lysine methyltransferase METTL21D n=1 Tax=Platysternon megacephalum TaxID=55544 RepID=A0A4D9EA94_9SAUR|nr:protein-lysine methyltransferase METTL21D [Platysternon megacephalum]